MATIKIRKKYFLIFKLYILNKKIQETNFTDFKKYLQIISKKNY